MTRTPARARLGWRRAATTRRHEAAARAKANGCGDGAVRAQRESRPLGNITHALSACVAKHLLLLSRARAASDSAVSRLPATTNSFVFARRTQFVRPCRERAVCSIAIMCRSPLATCCQHGLGNTTVCNSCAQLREHETWCTYANCHLTKMLQSEIRCCCCCHSCHNLSSRPRLDLAWLWAGLALSRSRSLCNHSKWPTDPGSKAAMQKPSANPAGLTHQPVVGVSVCVTRCIKLPPLAPYPPQPLPAIAFRICT